jgi:N-acetylneuraminate synthase
MNTYIIGEIGINHNGDIDIAKKLIDMAVFAGCDAVKFQKRTIEDVYTPEELDKPRESVFGKTNGDLKRGLEFNLKEYKEIDKYCKDKGIEWFASPWDIKSVEFLEKFNLPYYKVASAMLTNDALLERLKGKRVILSTGMSTVSEIDHAVDILGDPIIMHCTSTYPTKLDELNLYVIPWLKERYDLPVGYSGHETGIVESVIAVVLGAKYIERHITLDRSMWGSDQSASLEPNGLNKMVRDIRNLPDVLGSGIKKVYDSEIPIKEKLRR